MSLKISSKPEGTTVTLKLAGRLSAIEAQEFNQTFPELVQGMQVII